MSREPRVFSDPGFLFDAIASNMTGHDELQRELDDYLSREGEDLIGPDGTTYKCLPSSPDFASEFIPGSELENKQLRVRVSRTHMTTKPALQTLWQCREQTWRLKSLTPHRTAFVLNLEDPEN